MLQGIKEKFVIDAELIVSSQLAGNLFFTLLEKQPENVGHQDWIAKPEGGLEVSERLPFFEVNLLYVSFRDAERLQVHQMIIISLPHQLVVLLAIPTAFSLQILFSTFIS